MTPEEVASYVAKNVQNLYERLKTEHPSEPPTIVALHMLGSVDTLLKAAGRDSREHANMLIFHAAANAAVAGVMLMAESGIPLKFNPANSEFIVSTPDAEGNQDVVDWVKVKNAQAQASAALELARRKPK